MSRCIWAVIALSACAPVPDEKLVVVAVDVTSSVTDDELSRWLPYIDQLIVRAKPRHELILFALDDNTTQSEPILRRDRSPKSRTLSRELGWRRKFAEARRKWEEAKPSLAGKNAIGTHIIELVARLPQLAQGRQIELWLFSDMIQQSPQLDLARDPITNREAEVATRLAKQVIEQKLDGRVYCILGYRRRQVSVAWLRSFWRIFFQEAGLELVWFDSVFPEEVLDAE